MPSAAVPGIQDEADCRPAFKGLPLPGPSALPVPLKHGHNGIAALGLHAAAAAAEAGVASTRATVQQTHSSHPASRAASAQAPLDWSFLRRQSFGQLGRRSYERCHGGVAAALAEQRQRRLLRRDARPAAKQRAHVNQQADGSESRQGKLRSRGLSCARLQQAAAAASAAHDAVSEAVAEACRQQQRRQAAQQPEQPPTPLQLEDTHVQRAASHAAHQAPQQSLAPADQQPDQGAEAPPPQQHSADTQQHATPQQLAVPLQQPAGGLAFMVSDADDWALRQRSGQAATPQNSLPLCLQWMDALGSGSIPLLVPTTPTAAVADATAAPAAPPPLPPAPCASGGGAAATGPADIGELPKLRSLRPRPRRRARLPAFPAAASAASEDTADCDPASPGTLKFGSFGARNRLARSVSNSSASSGGRSYRRCSSSGDFSSTPSISPFAAYSDTPFEDDD